MRNSKAMSFNHVTKLFLLERGYAAFAAAFMSLGKIKPALILIILKVQAYLRLLCEIISGFASFPAARLFM